MGILSTVESAAEGAVVGGPAGAAVGAANGFLQSLSLKQVLRIVGGLALLVLIGWAALLNSRLHERDAQIAAAENALQVSGIQKPKSPKDLAGAIFVLAADRDRYKTQDALKKVALDSQSNSIKLLGQQSEANAELSRQALDLASKSAANRSSWINDAEISAHRTTLLPDAQELTQCKEAMDALYQNNF
jgi:hypothetical protein